MAARFICVFAACPSQGRNLRFPAKGDCPHCAQPLWEIDERGGFPWRRVVWGVAFAGLVIAGILLTPRATREVVHFKKEREEKRLVLEKTKNQEVDRQLYERIRGSLDRALALSEAIVRKENSIRAVEGNLGSFSDISIKETMVQNIDRLEKAVTKDVDSYLQVVGAAMEQGRALATSAEAAPGAPPRDAVDEVLDAMITELGVEPQSRLMTRINLLREHTHSLGGEAPKLTQVKNQFAALSLEMYRAAIAAEK